MQFTDLLEALSSPSAYPHPCEGVEVRQTHISAVFLAGPYAYKVKKPRDLGFLDFTSLARRHHFCREEVRLNRRLAPRAYLGVLPVTVRKGALKVDGEGVTVEWLVWMKRLPDASTLLARLGTGDLTAAELEALAQRLARFHAAAERNRRVAAFGSWDVVARNARENFEQTAEHKGRAVSRRVHRRFAELTEQALSRLKPAMEELARRNVPCDTHGDLHLDHVYHFPGRERPDDWVVVDCIEFNERYRYADPVADVAFLAMDLVYRGRRDLARVFAAAYLTAAGDAEGADLLPFYMAYRAAVRAKVDGWEGGEEEVPSAARQQAFRSAQAHWLLGLGELEEPGRRPCLLCVGGLPGTGKSTLARELERRQGFQALSTDRVRKELAGIPAEASARAPFGEGLYTAAWTRRVYGECLRRAERILYEGGRALVDGNFGQEEWRNRFLGAAREWAVPALFLHLSAPVEGVRERLFRRGADPSDADWPVYEACVERWEPFGEKTVPAVRGVDTDAGPEAATRFAEAILRAEGVA